MNELTPFEIYLLTLIGIATCFLVLGYFMGDLRGYNRGYDEGFETGLDAQIIDGEEDDDDEELEISDAVLEARVIS